MAQDDFDRNAGAAVLGMYAALCICRKLDIDPQDLLNLMLDAERSEFIETPANKRGRAAHD